MPTAVGRPLVHDPIGKSPRGPWLGSKVGESRPGIAARGAIEKKGERSGALSQFGERRDRCIEIERDFAPDGDSMEVCWLVGENGVRRRISAYVRSLSQLASCLVRRCG